MTINMLMFEFREAEKKFFKDHTFDDYNITFFEECLNEEFADKLSREMLDNTNVISVFTNSTVNRAVTDKFKNLRIISTRSTGYDHICVNTCQDKNIALINVPEYGETSVAQFTMGLIISLIRNIVPGSGFFTAKEINIEDLIGRDLTKLTLGVVGTGAIGAAVCKLAMAFGIHVVAADLREKQELKEYYNIEYLPLEDLVQISDIISLHIPYYNATRHIFSESIFSKCKDNMYIINTSRSELIDMKSLYENIENKKIKGAAMDIVTCDSVNFNCKNFSDHLNNNSLECLNEMKYLNKLKKHKNVIITPHIAYLTQDAIDTILEKTMVNIKEAIKGDKMCRIV